MSGAADTSWSPGHHQHYQLHHQQNPDLSGDLTEGDRTQPLEEIASAVRQLNNIRPSNSQETDVIDSAPSSQGELPPATPTSPYEVVQKRVQEKPTDVDAWIRLVRLSQDSGEYDKVTGTYEALLSVFPNVPSAQIGHITHVLESSNATRFQVVAGLFNRFLKTSPFVDLWKFYLSHVRKLNQDPSARDTIRKAYEFALDRIGHETESGDVWTDYIQFLKAGEAATVWNEGQKMDAIRKAYQRAVQAPLTNVKKLWEEYTEFENNLNKQLAKKFLSDLQPYHNRALAAMNAFQNLTTALFPPPILPGSSREIWLPRPPSFVPEEKALVARWKKYLKWEESNPLEIEEKNANQFRSRMQSVYRKAVICMKFYPEIWYMAYVWTTGLSNDASLPENTRQEKRDEALGLLKAGIESNPKSFLLNFAYAEALENSKNLKAVHEAFIKFLEVLRSDLEELEPPLIKIETTSSAELASPSSSQPQQLPGNLSANSSTSSLRISNASFTLKADDMAARLEEFKDRKTEYGIVWVMYMRFARRAETVASARELFAKARKDKWTPWEVYEAAALLEYHCNKKDDVAKRIFERGLKKFPDEESLALRYLGFLISINDDANARALFEQIVTTFPPERARLIWERWARYEYQYGTLEASQNLEKRLAEIYPNDPSIKRFAERHKYLNVDAIAVRDLGFRLNRGITNTSLPPTSTPTPRPNNNNPSTSTSGGGVGGIPLSPGITQDFLNSISSFVGATGSGAVLAPTSSNPGKRPSSPGGGRKRDENHPPSKRQRPDSPTRGSGSGPPPLRQRRESSSRERGGERDGSGRKESLEEGGKDVSLPPVLTWFMNVLPSSAAFDGPKFNADDMMRVLRGAAIPSSTGIRPLSPSPSLPLPRVSNSGAGGPRERSASDYFPHHGPPRRGRY